MRTATVRLRPSGEGRQNRPVSRAEADTAEPFLLHESQKGLLFLDKDQAITE